MKPVNTKQLVKTIKHLMVDKGVEIGHRAGLREKVSEKLGRRVHISTLHNAISGYRTGESSVEVLNALQSILMELPEKEI